MKVIIAGSRGNVRASDVECAMQKFCVKHTVTEVVCGMAPGADTLGLEWARARNIPVKKMPANWKPDGPKGKTDMGAGHKRNREMGKYAEALVAVWDGVSDGTKGMIDIAKRMNLVIYIHRTDRPKPSIESKLSLFPGGTNC